MIMSCTIQICAETFTTHSLTPSAYDAYLIALPDVTDGAKRETDGWELSPFWLRC